MHNNAAAIHKRQTIMIIEMTYYVFGLVKQSISELLKQWNINYKGF
jgi:hypothetical protein